jgi:glycosyltransferase involved in cell wall biosynthesis
MKLIFYSKRFIVGGMENAVYHLARLLKRDLHAEITIVYEIIDDGTFLMTEKYKKEFDTQYFLDSDGSIKDFYCDVLINCDPNAFDLPYIHAKHTIHWLHSRCVNYKNFPHENMAICQSEWHKQELKALGIDAVVVKNPLDIQLIRELALQEVDRGKIPENRIIYLMACRISPEKGLDRAISFMKKEYNKANILVVIGAPTYPKNEQIKERMIFKLGKRVVFLGEKINPYPYMLLADYICSFADSETYGIVSEEAHILNKPVVFSKYDTAKDQFIEGFDSWISEDNYCKNNAVHVYDEKKNIDALEQWKRILNALEIG